jgi:hypothetical protein
MDAVQDGVEAAGWDLSGLQKTTSHHFEGRWEGERTRSAYLFFHKPGGLEAASVDIYLDETSQGLRGNLALVLEGRTLGDVGDPVTAVRILAHAARERLPKGYRTPMTLRFRLESGEADPREARSEIRFKIEIPRAAFGAGPSAVSALASAVVRAFEDLVQHPAIEGYVSAE